MLSKSDIYKKYVTDDVINRKGLLHSVKSPFYMRIKAKMINPSKLHPNPDDEFSMENIGPNWEIIANYEKNIKINLMKSGKVFEEPLAGVKLNNGEYMLLNGHHRWMAAMNLGIKKVPVSIINITSEEDIYRVVNKSSRNICVTIDLDEVLLADKTFRFPLSALYKKNIRDNSSLLIRELHRMNFDVWVYTGSYKSEEYVRGLFFFNNSKIDGMVNGVNGGKNALKIRDIFRNKYKYIVHVDNYMLTCVNTATKEYEIIDIDADGDKWSSAVAQQIKQLNISV